MATDLADRLADLDAGLDQFGAGDSAPSSIGDVFNALLAEAKKQKPGDPVVSAIEPVGKTFDESEFVEINCGALRTLIQQLITALRA